MACSPPFVLHGGMYDRRSVKTKQFLVNQSPYGSHYDATSHERKALAVKTDLASRNFPRPVFFHRAPCSTVVEYAHAFCEGIYRRRRALASPAGRRGRVPFPRSASSGLARDHARAADDGGRSARVPRAFLLHLSIPLAHGFARGAPPRSSREERRTRQGHVRHRHLPWSDKSVSRKTFVLKS